jgi:L-amino acid N-acyltransferase YncA
MSIDGLKDGTAVTIRESILDDLDQTVEFFRLLPASEGWYLRVDPTSRESVDKRIRQGLAGDLYRVVALVEEKIVGIGALEFARDPSRAHVSELRCIVAREYRHKGLGGLMMRELLAAAQKRKVEKVMVRLAASQIDGRKICEQLGLHLDAVIGKRIKDSRGNYEDLIVMSCTLDEMWRELTDFYKERNWPDG